VFLGLAVICGAAASGQLVMNLVPTHVDDTAQIQTALDNPACKSAPGCSIRLAAGTYHVDQIGGFGYFGEFRGAGKGKTVLLAKPNLDFSSFNPANPPSKTNRYPFLVYFLDGEIRISDLTIRADEPVPTTGWDALGFPIYQLAALLVVLGSESNSVLERLSLEGAPSPLTSPLPGKNVFNGTYHESGSLAGNPAQTLKGNHRIIECDYRHSINGASISVVSDGEFVIGGEPGKGNRFRELSRAMFVEDLWNAVVTISHNDIEAYNNGLWLMDYAWPVAPASKKPSLFTVERNRIRVTGPPINFLPTAGIFASIDDMIKAGSTISGNVVRLDNPGFGALVYGTHGALFERNVVTGEGPAAFALDWIASGALVNWNHVQGFKPTTAHFWLGAQTSGNRLAGVTPDLSVKDEGTGNTVEGPGRK
jgi:hypothetical protein